LFGRFGRHLPRELEEERQALLQRIESTERVTAK
jgi:hypothetical protein